MPSSHTHLNALIDSLSLDHRRGAAEIVEDAGQLFVDIAKVGCASEASGGQLFTRAVRRLAEGQPSMAPVLNLLNRVCIMREEGGGFQELVNRLQLWRDAAKSDSELMTSQAQRLPRVDGTLLTFSNSSTVASIIIACRENGWPERVLLSEGRPMMEGAIMARKLIVAGVPVTFYTDAALFSQITQAQAVWVGGDSLSRRGLVNKAGSLALALLAKQSGIPFISLMDSGKILSPQLVPYFRFIKQNPREIAAGEVEGLDVVNEYYETIPLDLVTYVFTEKGISSPVEVISGIENDPISSLFVEIIKGGR